MPHDKLHRVLKKRSSLNVCHSKSVLLLDWHLQSERQIGCSGAGVLLQPVISKRSRKLASFSCVPLRMLPKSGAVVTAAAGRCSQMLTTLALGLIKMGRPNGGDSGAAIFWER